MSQTTPAPQSQTYHSHVRSDVFPFLPKGGTLLDIGGGDGATASAIKERGLADRVGVADMVKPAPHAKLDFDYQGDLTGEGFIERIGEEQGPFDTILACDILEHFTDPWTIVERLHAQLKPGGSLVASIPNIRHHSVSLKLLAGGDFTYTESGILDRTHLRFFVRETAKKLMESSGLKIRDVAPLPSGRRIDHALMKLPFAGLHSLAALQYAIRAERVD